MCNLMTKYTDKLVLYILAAQDSTHSHESYIHASELHQELLSIAALIDKKFDDCVKQKSTTS